MTSTGFEYELNEEALYNWDYLEAIENLKNGDTSLANVKTVFTLLIGAEGFNNLKAHTGGNIKKMMAEFKEICEDSRLKK